MKPLRIIIVEDESIIAEATRMDLEDMGHEVVAVVATGEEAVNKSGTERPDLILVDIMLKGKMNGIHAAQIIKDKFNIPHIYTTAYADKDRLKEAQKTTPCGFIEKPFTYMDLNLLIKECFSNRTV